MAADIASDILRTDSFSIFPEAECEDADTTPRASVRGKSQRRQLVVYEYRVVVIEDMEIVR